MTTYHYFVQIARGFDLEALRQIAHHADSHHHLAADPTQREGRAKASLAKLSEALREAITLAEEG